MRRLLSKVTALFLPAVFAVPVGAIEPDDSTLLLLHCQNSLISTNGKAPDVTSSITYEAGMTGLGAFLGTSSSVRFPAASNAINPPAGTFEAWIRPRWAGSDGASHTFLRIGDAGGLIIVKDGANNLRLIVNRYGSGGNPEKGVAYNISGWPANQWHHIAMTWDSSALRLYTDGQLRTSSTPSFAPPQIIGRNLYLGIDGSTGQANAVMDEVRISNRARTASEIAQSFLADLPNVSSLTCTPSSWEAWPGWTLVPAFQAATALGTLNVPSAGLSWTSSQPSVASADAAGRVQALTPGSAVLTASLNGVTTNLTVTVKAPVRAFEDLPVEPALATPMPNALFDMPVAVITYLPTRDGISLDAAEAGDGSTLATKKAYITALNTRTKFMLEEGSRYHGYQDPLARPSLGYRIVKNIVVYEPLPPLEHGSSTAVQPDYRQILTRWGAESLVKEHNVKEFWLWGYHTSKISPVESNMSSPVTGDISNSYRIDDLPVYDRTYVLYNYNFTRSQAEAVHNHGHQLESILSYANQRQDGNTVLWWDQFCGRNANGTFQKGRCGNTHLPPNAAGDYDYLNMTPVPSDCFNWTPAKSGPLTNVSAATWGNLPYNFPATGGMGQITESKYYVFWMQNMPGYRNGIRHGAGEVMRNWWEFTADWDGAIGAGHGLHKVPQAALDVQKQGAGAAVWTLTGDAGLTWELQSSPDLQSWQPALRLSPFTGEAAGPLTTAGDRGFLRAVLIP